MDQEPFDWGGVKKDSKVNPNEFENGNRNQWRPVLRGNTSLLVALWLVFLAIVAVALAQMWASSYRITVPMTVQEWTLLLWHPLEGDVGRFPDGNSPLILANYLRVAGTFFIDLCAVGMLFAFVHLAKAPAAGCQGWSRLAMLFLVLGVGLVSLLSPIVFVATNLPKVGDLLLNQGAGGRNEYLAEMVEAILFVSFLLATLSLGCYVQAIRRAADELKMPAVGASAWIFWRIFACLHLLILVLAWLTCAAVAWLNPGVRAEDTVRPAVTKIWFGVWCLFSFITLLGCNHHYFQISGMMRGDLNEDRSFGN